MLTHRLARFAPLLLMAVLLVLGVVSVGAQDTNDTEVNERCQQLGLSPEDCRVYLSLPASFLERCRLQVATPQGCIRLWQMGRNTGNSNDLARCRALGLEAEACRIYSSLPQSFIERCRVAGLSPAQCVRLWLNEGNPKPNPQLPNDPILPICPDGVQPTPERPCRLNDIPPCPADVQPTPERPCRPNDIPVCPDGVQPTPERPCRPNDIPVCPDGVQPTPERPCRPRPCADPNQPCNPPRPCANSSQPCPPPNPGASPNPGTPPNPNNIPPLPPNGNTPPRGNA